MIKRRTINPSIHHASIRMSPTIPALSASLPVHRSPKSLAPAEATPNMAPLPSSNSSENSSPISTAAATNIPCSCLSSFAIRRHFPSASPSPTQHSSRNEPTWGPPNLVSAVEGYVRALRDAASGNPFLKSVLSLSDNIQSFCQMQLRNLNGLNPRGQTSLSAHNFAAILPGNSVAGLVVANGLTNFLNLYNTLLVCRILLTWFPSAPPAIVSPLSTLCDPYLNIFRGIIPPLGGTLDLSPILAFLVLNAFTSTAAALPAELPESRTSRHGLHSSQLLPLNLTIIQQKWKKRLSSMQNKNPEGAN